MENRKINVDNVDRLEVALEAVKACIRVPDCGQVIYQAEKTLDNMSVPKFERIGAKIRHEAVPADAIPNDILDERMNTRVIFERFSSGWFVTDIITGDEAADIEMTGTIMFIDNRPHEL